MTETATNDMILEILRRTHKDLAGARRKETTKESNQNKKIEHIRKLLIAMHSVELQMDAKISEIRSDIDRIKNRLELTDA